MIDYYFKVCDIDFFFNISTLIQSVIVSIFEIENKNKLRFFLILHLLLNFNVVRFFFFFAKFFYLKNSFHKFDHYGFMTSKNVYFSFALNGLSSNPAK